ncbi:MAG: hypothetical protein FWG16_04190, partial [Micrococcales bacterium]|nr:hypothetical protein [Micrococcales bacterium]
NNLQFQYWMDLDQAAGHMNQRWTVTNNSATTLRGNKLFWGGDTAFAGSVTGYTDVLVGMNMLFTGNINNANAGTLSIQGSATTPWSGYYGGPASGGSGGWVAISNHALPNTVTGPADNNVNTSIFVEWALPDLPPGQSASVTGALVIKDPENLTVLGDGPSTGLPGELVAHTFMVKNSTTTTLSGIEAIASSTNGWETIVVQPPPQTLSTGQSAEVVVLVRVPPGAQTGDFSDLSLSVTALQGTSPISKADTVRTSVIQTNTWVPDVFTGNAAIAGLNMPGQTLTAQSSWSLTPDGALSYQWFLNGTLISGATTDTLSPVDTADFKNGDLLRVQVTGNKAGFPSFMAFAMVPIISPALVGSAQITGLLFAGETLTAEIAWNYPEVVTSNIVWSVNGTAVPTNNGLLTFDTTGLQVGDIVWVSANGTKSGFQGAQAEAGIRLGGRSFQGSVAIVGLNIPGQILTAVDSWSQTPDAVAYQWSVNGVVDKVQTGATFDTSGLLASDVVSVLALATCSGMAPASATAQVALFEPPGVPETLYGSATILGLTEIGQELTASSSWNETPDSVTYSWYVNGSETPAATGETFDTTGLDDEDQVTLVAEAVKQGYTPASAETSVLVFDPEPELENLVGSATISGLLVPGEELTADSFWEHEPDSVTYTWYVNGSETPAATGLTFDTTGLNEGDIVSVVAEASLAGYTLGQASFQVELEGEPPPPPPGLYGSVTITGNLLPGNLLTAETAWIIDEEYVSLAYQWFVDGVAVENETDQTFDTTGLSGGALVSVEVYASAEGYSTVPVSDQVELQLLAIDGSVTIVGLLTAGQTLAAYDVWDDEVDSVTYQWLVNGVVDLVQTGQTFDTTGLIGGDVITVVAVATRAGFANGEATDQVSLQLLPLSGSAIISGLAVPGNTLTASASWSETGVSEVFTWYLDGTLVKSGTAGTGDHLFDTTGLVGGEVIDLVITGSKAGFSNGQATADVTIQLVALSGAASISLAASSPESSFVPGAILQCQVSWNDTPDSQTVTWYRNGIVQVGQTGWTINTAGWASGTVARCDVSATKSGLSPGSATASQVVAALPTFTGSVSITGDTAVGETLTAVPGTWSQTPYQVTYQWYVNGTAVPMATGSTFSTSGRSPGDVVKVEVLAKVLGYQDLTVSVQTSLTQNDPGALTITMKGWVDLPTMYPPIPMLIELYATEVPSGATLAPGTEVWWTYYVTNPSGVPVYDVTVTDSMLNDLGNPEDIICATAVLASKSGFSCSSVGTVNPS